MARVILSALLVACVFTGAPPAAAVAGPLDEMVRRVARDAVEQFKEQKLGADDFAISVIDLRDGPSPRTGSYRGDVGIFPASVVKLFYLAATHRWLEDGRLDDSPELRRTMRDMIVDSSNDATAMIVDALTETLNGPPLPEEKMKEWAERRNAVNRYFASLGYRVGGNGGINVCQKTYCEGPYGREKLFIGEEFENRNKLTTDATARLVSEIVQGKAVSPERSKQMMELLRRNPAATGRGGDDQSAGFSASGLPPGTKLWSKAGWTSTARHDAAYVESADGRLKAVVVIFTTGHAHQRQILPAMVERLISALQQPLP